MTEFAQAKHYIANREQLADMQCGICYQLDPDMLRCKGSCKKIFCLHCITRSKSKNNNCPMRCTEVFQVEEIPHLEIWFDCPYSKQQCNEVINDTKKFRSHLRTCQYIPPVMLEEIQKADSFLCKSNHKLLFLNQKVFQKMYKVPNFYTTTMNQTCSLCKNQTLCSSICPLCSSEEKKEVFCMTCRPLPCTKQMCPIGHQYEKSEVNSKTMVCDFCGVNIAMFGRQSYRDAVCNFDVCQKCHNELPETHPLVPLKNHLYVGYSNSSDGFSSQYSFQQEVPFEEEGSIGNSSESSEMLSIIDSNNAQDQQDIPNEDQQLSVEGQDDNFGNDYFDQE